MRLQHGWVGAQAAVQSAQRALTGTVGGEVIEVPPDADAETMEALRARLEATLNDATRRAYVAVGRAEGGHA